MRRLIALGLLITMSVSAIACDICGSGAGGSYLGILPEFRKRFIGFRYQQNGLTSHLGQNGSTTYLTARENYRVMELWGAANMGKKFRLAAFIPVNFMERSSQQEKSSRQGLGDVTAIGYYQLLNSKHTTREHQLLIQSLWIGGGLKVPAGKYNPEEKNLQQSSQNSFQLGTGSIDFSIHTMYDIRLQDAGINTNMSYKVNTPNKYDYKYGNKFTLNVLGYYKFRIGKVLTIAPNSGVLFESAKKDSKTSDIYVWETGGRSLTGTVGMEVNAGKISIGSNFQTPLSQELGEGKIRAANRGMVHLSLSF